jgi:hypothetical protein
MKTKFAVILSLALAGGSLIGGCRMFEVVDGSGNVVTENRPITEFSGVELEGIGNVILTQDSGASLRFEGEDNILKVMKAEVKGVVLVISTDKNIKPTKPLTIYVSSREIKSLEVEGSGEISAAKTIMSPALKLSISGSGKMKLEVNTQKMAVSIQGSGQTQLSGTVPSFEGEIDGSGKITAPDLRTETSDVSISGSGIIEIFASQKVKGEVNGSGNIYYHGVPEKVLSSINGSGTITKR